ncbi:MAG TPA: DNA-binding response regulator [Candidatus Moranbacteria bacterium]|nr:DNA-binding response regulator [Candidatus Moranbacteria bacterium]
MRILVVEDEPAIARIIKSGLQKGGHVVDVVEDGIEAKNRVEIYDYDIAVLDVMLPGADGYEICYFIRNLGLDTKIIMLTAKDDIDSKVSGLDVGADDYMTKPFAISELEARIRALARRERIVCGAKLKVKSLTLDLSTKTALVNNKPLKTSLTEYRLLEYLIRHKDEVCSRTMISENVWGDKDHISNVIEATISKLRNKIKKLNNNKDIIFTIPKSGYRIY